MYNEEFGDTSREEGMSVEDCQAEEIMNQSSTLLDRHYQVGSTFPNDVPHRPDSLRTEEEISVVETQHAVRPSFS